MASALGEGDEFGFGATGEEEEATGEGNDEEEGGSDEDVDIFVGEMDPMAFLRVCPFARVLPPVPLPRGVGGGKEWRQ